MSKKRFEGEGGEPSQEAAETTITMEEGESGDFEITSEHREELEQSDREATQQRIDELHQKIARQTRPTAELSLSAAEQAELTEHIAAARADSRWVAPALAKGNRTATTYDSQVTPFSTTTRILTLSSGKKIFLVHNYALSGVHRELDALMKRFTGLKMRKAPAQEWKNTFEARSQIPTIPNDDPDTVALPFVPNINLYDLFFKLGEIKDFGDCAFAEKLDTAGLLEILQKVAAKIKELHESGLTWGETNLPNIIIDAEQNIHICDPETRYDADVPLPEQRARDLMEFLMSSCAAMQQVHQVDYQKVVDQTLTTYSDPTVIDELQKLARQKPTLGQRLFFGYLQGHLALKNFQEFLAIKQAIANFSPSKTAV